MYEECEQAAPLLSGDYREHARRRIDNGHNVLISLSSPLGSMPAIYPGLEADPEDPLFRPSSRAEAAVRKGGTWTIKLPDTGCPNIDEPAADEYMIAYNRFALVEVEALR